jgi:hypothetical protein
MHAKALRLFLCVFALSSAAFAAKSISTVAGLPPEAQSIIAAAIRANNAVSGDTWIKQATLTPSNGGSGDIYGFGLGSVAVDGNIIAVGVPFYSGNGAPYPGAVYVFVKSGSDWTTMTQAAILTASNPATEAQIGATVAISGDTIVTGTLNLGSPYVAAVYVYVKPATGWTNMTETAQLTSTDGGINAHSVAISGNTIVASGPDAATSSLYVYVEPAGGWTNMTQTAELTASASSHLNYIGGAVSIDGNTVAATAEYPGGSRLLGAVAVFVEPTGGWTNMTQTAVLSATDAGATLRPVAISGNTIAAGDQGAVIQGNAAAGNVHVYVRPASGWRNMSQTAILSASDAAGGEVLGYSVGIDGNTIVAGAPGADINFHQNSGAAYVFTAPPSGWVNMTESAKLYFPDGYAGGLGDAVAIQGNIIVASAPYTDEDGQQYVGEAVVFQQ